MYRLPFAISLEKTTNLLKTIDNEFALNDNERILATKLLESGLPPLVRREILSHLFGISLNLLLSMSSNPELHYRTYRIRKASRGYRHIEAPRRFLKLVQRWIYDYILSNIPIPPSAHGFVPGRDIFSNVQPHLTSKNIMVIDIKDFFPSIKEKQVRHVFKELGFPLKVTITLTDLCTFDRRLPQGAPTSPALANIIFSPVDNQLTNLAKEWKCQYTRYADDLVFSGNIKFTNTHKAHATKIIEAAGFRINTRKTRIIGGGGRQMVAGLVANEKGLPPRQKRMNWRAQFHQASLNPEKFKGDGLKLMGVAAFVNKYNPILSGKYKEIAQAVIKLESNH
jgi:retron-type reverse transcriptase